MAPGRVARPGSRPHRLRRHRVALPASPIRTGMCSPNRHRTAAPKPLVQMARHAVAHAEDCNGQGGNRSTLISRPVPPIAARRARDGRHARRQTPPRRSRPPDGVRCGDHPRRLRLRLPDPRLRPAHPHHPRRAAPLHHRPRRRLRLPRLRSATRLDRGPSQRPMGQRRRDERRPTRPALRSPSSQMP